jgi:hypothetical protein
MQVAGAVLAVLLVEWLMSDTAAAAHFGAPKVTTAAAQPSATPAPSARSAVINPS